MQTASFPLSSAHHHVAPQLKGKHMTKFLVAASAFALIATPVSAQLLGGSGGGSLGGGLGGSIGRTTGTATGSATGSVRSTGEQTVDRRSGRVRTERQVQGNGSVSADSVVQRSGRSIGSSASGGGSGSGSIATDSQLVGTDALRSTASGTTNSAVALAQGTRATAQDTVRNGTRVAGSSAARGSAAGMSTFSGAAGQLALAGSAAGNAAGNFDLSPGTMIVNERGRAIGEVQQVMTDSRGRVEALIVDVQGSDELAIVSAANFTGSGDVLISSMSRGALEEAAEDQAEARDEAGNDAGGRSPSAIAAGNNRNNATAPSGGARDVETRNRTTDN
jgi:PRC-barrel domain